MGTTIKQITVKDHEEGELGNMRMGPPRVTHVVDANGRVTQPRYAMNLSSWLLEVTKKGVRLSQEAEKEGYRFLEDLYDAEGKQAYWAEYLRWWEHRNATGQASEFPVAMLPQAVRDLVRDAPERQKFKPDPLLMAEAEGSKPKAERR